MAGIGGIGSGININEIVTASVVAERAPKEMQLKRLGDSATAKISALGSLKGALAEFADALKALKAGKLFNERQASVSGSKKEVSVTAEKNAQLGLYQLEVKQLAKSSKIASGAIKGGADTKFKEGGEVQISLGEKTFKLEVKAGSTLGELQEHINQELKQQGISANLVNDPKTGESRLVLSAKDGGEGNDLTLSIQSNDNQLKALGEQTQVLQKATNAQFTIDGLPMESASNEVKGVIKGVTLKLSEVTEKAVTVKVESNQAEIKKSLHQFVEAYNKLHATCKELGRVVPVEGGEPLVGKLTGDSSLRNLQNQLNSALSSMMPGEMHLLSDLGISSDKDGKLKIDDKTLDKQLAEHYSAATDFLSGDKGLMQRLEKSISAYNEKGGILETRINGEQKVRDSVKQQQQALELRMQSVEKNLYAKFIAMDRLVSQLHQTSGGLNGLLAGLPGGR